MSLVSKHRPYYTVEDYVRWQGDWELIEGMPYSMASPRPINQILLITIAQLLYRLLDACENCHVAAELDWYVSEDTVIRPDLMVFCGEVPERVEEPPELVLEIISPSSRQMDEGLKFELCQREGVKYFVLIYPDEKSVKAFELVGSVYREKRNKIFKFGPCEVSIDFLEIFSKGRYP